MTKISGLSENIIQSNKNPQKGPVAKHKVELKAFVHAKLLARKITHSIRQFPIKNNQKYSTIVK